jgi:hypothetical protein
MKVLNKIPAIIRRIFVIGFLVALVGFVALGMIAKNSVADTPPTAKQAPWAVQTVTRIFYAEQFKMDGKTPVIRGYWTYDGRHYAFVDGALELDKEAWGKVTVVRRAK